MTAIELDQTQKQEGHKLVQDAILNVGRYMAAAIAYANRKADLPDEEFWRRLFIPTDPNGQRSILNGTATPKSVRQTPMASWICRRAIST